MSAEIAKLAKAIKFQWVRAIQIVPGDLEAMPCCANYQTQRDAFHNFLRPESPAKILLFRGQSGSGKTTLVETCLKEKSREVPHIPFTFRPGLGVDLAEIFHRTGDHIGWEKMDHFNQEVDRMNRAPAPVQVRGGTQIGSYNSIQVILQADSPTQRNQNQVQLTRAWFNDLQSQAQILLIVFDGFEKAPQEVQEWIAGPFLERVVVQPYLRVLVTGQQIPESHNIEWGHCCEQFDLWGIPDANHWKPVIEEMGRCFPDSIHNPDDWLAGVCHALKGNPSEIIKIIEGLPQRG
jgi:hypothetical protein